MSTPQDPHIADLPALLAGRGVVIGYRLTIAAPKEALDDDLRRLLKKYRPVLVEALARAETLGNPAVTFAHVLTCDRDGFDWSGGEQKLEFSTDADDDGLRAAWLRDFEDFVQRADAPEVEP